MIFLLKFCLILLSFNLSVGEPYSKLSPVYKPKPVYKPEDTCETVLCNQALDQAKTLTKFSVLDEFVDQTILLLRDLMKSYDVELRKSAMNLIKNLGSQCPETTDMLEQLLQSKDARDSNSGLSQVLGEGMEPLSEQNVDDSREGKQTYSTTWSVSQGKDPGYGSGSGNQISGSQNQKSYNGDWSETQNQWKPSSTTPKYGQKKSPWKPITDYDYGQQKESEEGDDGQDTQQWTDKNNGWNNKHGQRPGHGHGHKHGHGHGHGHGGGKGKQLDHGKSPKKGCHGIEKGSEPYGRHWVPGLDDWCVNNCAMGYCPVTHCVCH